jgi:hypothetical protein
MKNTFQNVISLINLVVTILVGIFLYSFQKSIDYKWAPLTAAETLKKENFLNSKRDTYFQAIDIINREFANSNFIEDSVSINQLYRNKGGEYPTELEVNTCYDKLCLYSDKKDIPLTYFNLFKGRDSLNNPIKPIYEMYKFISLIRKDLGYDDILLDYTEFKYIVEHRKSGSIQSTTK